MIGFPFLADNGTALASCDPYPLAGLSAYRLCGVMGGYTYGAVPVSPYGASLWQDVDSWPDLPTAARFMAE